MIVIVDESNTRKIEGLESYEPFSLLEEGRLNAQSY